MAQGRLPKGTRATRTAVPAGQITVRIFTLADHAAISPGDEKLYISGAGIKWQMLPQFPGIAVQLYLAVLLGVPLNLVGQQQTIRIRLLNPDHNPVGPDPLLEATLEIGRPPGLEPGDELSAPLVAGLAGIRIERPGQVFFTLEIDGRELVSHPFRFRRPQGLTFIQQPPPGA